MLTPITKYLIQYKKVSIPHIGTFRVRCEAAELKFTDKRILPPSYVTEYIPGGEVEQHQLRFLAREGAVEMGEAASVMEQFGARLKRHLEGGELQWSGIGRLREESGRLVFEAETKTLDCLQPVVAEKVIRESSSHSVLRGEQEMTSENAASSLRREKPARSFAALIGWIILLLALSAIIYFLVRGGFNPRSAGMELDTMGVLIFNSGSLY